jgi:hypothetical protein
MADRRFPRSVHRHSGLAVCKNMEAKMVVVMITSSTGSKAIAYLVH